MLCYNCTLHEQAPCCTIAGAYNKLAHKNHYDKQLLIRDDSGTSWFEGVGDSQSLRPNKVW